MSGKFSCRYYRPADRPGLLSLFRAVYGNETDLKTSSWRYLDNPQEDVMIAVAEADGTIIGAQPSHVIRIDCRGSAAPGLLLLDVMTHPDHRGRGVFAEVVEFLRQDAGGRGIEILLTTPNEAAARGFRRLQQWRCLGELSPLLLPVEPGAILSRRPAIRTALRPLARLPFITGRHLLTRSASSRAVRSGPEFDGSNDTLWRGFRGTAPCLLMRDDRFIRWRYSRKSRGYRLHTVTDQRQTVALAVTAPGRLLGRDMLMLVDVMIPPERPDLWTRLLAAAYRDAQATGAAAILTYIAPRSPLLGQLRANGFWQIPSFLRPRAYSVWASGDPGSESNRALFDLGAWHMTLADSDLA